MKPNATELEKEADTVEARMSRGGPFTYGELCSLLGGNDNNRVADKTIQKWRKKGWISYTRERGRVVWRLTAEGIAAKGGN